MSKLDEESLLTKVPKHLRIRVLHDADDDGFMVIDKPCNLRSVPGLANTTVNTKNAPGTKSPGEQRRTAQEAWVLAIQSFGDLKGGNDNDNENSVSIQCLQRLAKNGAKSVPRKFKLFQRYLERNQKQLMLSVEEELLVEAMFQKIVTRQRPLLNLPEPTKHEESALGQLILMGYGRRRQDNTTNEREAKNSLRVVHRLDCETSGVMVFAKNEATASFLSKAWRDRDRVTKHYLALVKEWPPYHKDKQTEGSIDVPLAPKKEERLKWKATNKEDNDGKASITHWKVLEDNITIKESKGVVLQLQPVTGRTHQLRIHCAHIGSGIVGDSLYGRNQVEFDQGQFLHLHAWKLSFPRPNDEPNGVCEFHSCSPCSWYDPQK
jgi:tRNA pseudouridine32 synthase/23S rRNA pseudouridine746 synthase